jgi:hypothetical protein
LQHRTWRRYALPACTDVDCAPQRPHRCFSPPVDITDGAARIVDPIFAGQLTGTHVWGQFLKDYKPEPW